MTALPLPETQCYGAKGMTEVLLQGSLLRACDGGPLPAHRSLVLTHEALVPGGYRVPGGCLPPTIKRHLGTKWGENPGNL